MPLCPNARRVLEKFDVIWAGEKDGPNRGMLGVIAHPITAPPEPEPGRVQGEQPIDLSLPGDAALEKAIRKRLKEGPASLEVLIRSTQSLEQPVRSMVSHMIRAHLIQPYWAETLTPTGHRRMMYRRAE